MGFTSLKIERLILSIPLNTIENELVKNSNGECFFSSPEPKAHKVSL